MKLHLGRALEEVGRAMRQSAGLYLTVALAFGVLPTLVSSLALPNPQTAATQAPLVQFLLLTIVILLGIVGWIAIQRLSLLSESVGQAIARSPVPALKMFGVILLLALPVAFLMAPFFPSYQSSNPQEQAGAATAISLIMMIVLFPFVRFLLSLPIAAVEGGGVLQIMRRSWRLTRGNTWKLYGLALLFLIVLGLVTFVAQRALGSVILLLLGEPRALSVSALLLALSVQLAQLTITLPFTILVARLYAQATGGAVQASVPHAGHD